MSTTETTALEVVFSISLTPLFYLCLKPLTPKPESRESHNGSKAIFSDRKSNVKPRWTYDKPRKALVKQGCQTYLRKPRVCQLFQPQFQT